MSDPTRASVRELAEAVRHRDVSATEVAATFLARARRVDGELRAFLDLDETTVLAEARSLDEAIARGQDPGPLAGVPVALKDNICQAGRPTTCASRSLSGWRPPYDATVVRRLRTAGAVAFGKTNMDEFGMGSSCEHSAFQVTRNPWDRERVAGGSSGGSAAAVASRSCPAALGSDTGGSIRQPAALCGVVGVKPTYGRVSRFGLVAFGSSLDQVGPLARTVDDAATVLAAIAGHDARDSTSADEPMPDLDLRPRTTPFRFGVPEAAVGEGVAPGVRRAFEAALSALEAAGGERVEAHLPHADAAVATYYVVATAEASSNLARFDGVRYGHRAADHSGSDDMMRRSRGEGFGDEVKRRILLGTHVLSAGYHDAYYRRASRVRSLIARDFEEAFTRCDVIVTPTSPTSAFPLGDRLEDPLAMYLGDVFTVPANLAGLPAVSLPCALDESGLPVGLQLTGRRWDEAGLLDVARRLESIVRFGDGREPDC